MRLRFIALPFVNVRFGGIVAQPQAARKFGGDRLGYCLHWTAPGGLSSVAKQKLPNCAQLPEIERDDCGTSRFDGNLNGWRVGGDIK